MQRKLTAIQVSEVRKALESLQNTISLLSRTVIGVGGRTYKLEKHLHNICEHGTTDGKPWVEPEPPIPGGYRKANADEWTRKDVKYWDLCHKDWRPWRSLGIAFDPDSWGTSYIVPIDPPLTDQDACVWPRLLVMVRDDEVQPWFGPYQYQGKGDAKEHPFVVNSGKDRDRVWKQARRATPQEIKQAGLDRSENTAKVEPCRGHDQQGPQ